MYTKTIIMTKRSSKGKTFTCIREMTVMDEFEREERRREYYERKRAEILAERRHREAIDLHKYADYLNPTSMRKIMNAYEEYMDSERYY